MEIVPNNLKAVELEEALVLVSGDVGTVTGPLAVAADGESAEKTKIDSPYVVSYKKRFLICAFVAVLSLLAYNFVIDRIARSSQRRQLMTALDHIPPDTDCLFVGNSLVEAGCNPTAFQDNWPGGKIRPVNLALGATYPVEHYLIFKKALSGQLRV